MERRSFLKSFLFLPFLSLFYRPKGRKGGILLLETVVAGFSYYDGEKIWKYLNVGDPLILKRQPDNRYDEKAVEIYWKESKLGYIPRVDNSVISQMMDRGYTLKAQITWLKVDDDPWERIGIKVETDLDET